MRGVDRGKMLLNGKKPTVPHAPYTREMSHIISDRFLDCPELFYSKPEPARDVRVRKVGRCGPGTLHEIAFPSPLPTRWRENNTCYGYHVRLGTGMGAGRPAYVILHGWGRKKLDTELRVVGGRLAREGIESLFLVLPYHLRRAPGGGWSGEYMISGDVVRTAESFQQAVAEVRAILPWLKQYSPQVGLLGLSLGGIIAHLAMAVEPFRVGVSMLSGGNSAGITWHGRLTRHVRADIRRAGIELPELERIWSMTNPTLLARHNRVKNLLLFGAKFDEVVRPEFTLELWEALGRPTLRWVPSAHYSSLFFLPRMVRGAADFLHRHLE
jgi:dienelactone hydrolase